MVIAFENLLFSFCALQDKDMTIFYKEKVGSFFLMVDHACHMLPPSRRHPSRELRRLQFENHDGDARRLA